MLVDAEARERLRRLHAASQTLATHAVADLLRVMSVLERAGVRAVSIKGPAQSQDLYGDPGLRQSSDLDLVVAAADLDAARRRSPGAGFAPTHERFDVPLETLLRNENEIGMVGAGDRPLVELHWRVGERRAFGALSGEQLLRRRAGDRRCRARRARARRTRRHRAPLCSRAQHAWERLEFMVSVVAAARRVAAGRWPAVFDRAAELNCLRRTLVGLRVAHDALGVQPPVEVRLRAAADPRCAAWPAARPPRGAASRRPRTGRVRAPRGVVRAPRRLAAGRTLHLALRAATPGVQDWESLALPPRFTGLYHLWRPVRLTGKFVRLGVRPAPRQAEGESAGRTDPRSHRQERPAPGRTMRLVWGAAPGWTLANVVLAVVQGILPLLGVYLMKLIVDAVTRGIESGDAAAFRRPACSSSRRPSWAV